MERIAFTASLDVLREPDEFLPLGVPCQTGGTWPWAAPGFPLTLFLTSCYLSGTRAAEINKTWTPDLPGAHTAVWITGQASRNLSRGSDRAGGGVWGEFNGEGAISGRANVKERDAQCMMSPGLDSDNPKQDASRDQIGPCVRRGGAGSEVLGRRGLGQARAHAATFTKAEPGAKFGSGVACIQPLP